MQESPLQILEVRAGGADDAPVTITAAVSAKASEAIFVALSEQRARRRSERAVNAEEVLVLREHVALAERFQPLASAGAHAIVRLSAPELRTCLLELTDYANRVDGEHYQPAELRERVALIARISPILWDANAAAAAAEDELAHATH